jgi:hypothetical protein
MRWFNLVGFGMLAFAIYFDAWLYLYVWERFDIPLIAAFATYILVALGLSLWGSSKGE